MIYKFGTAYMTAGTIISIMLMIRGALFLGFLMGVFTLFPFLRDNK